MAKQDVKTYNTLSNYEGNPFINEQQPSPQVHRHQQRKPEENSDLVADIDTENDDTPQNMGVMIHVVPETNRTKWNHIEDLDSFFTRMYCYHQKHGFNVMMTQEVLELVRFIFVVIIIIVLFNCVNYPVLFNEERENKKITISDVISSPAECTASFSGYTWLFISMASLFWMFRLIKVLYHFIQFRDIKLFFNTALKIDDNDLDNLTWHEVQRRVRDVQSEQQMCIHKEQLTELDIYHRILRFKNYMVAMMNKNLLPSKITFPLIGEFVCLSRSLQYNIELLLFWGPWSPFENNWHLREDYKRSNRRIELANRLSNQIMWVALANLVLSPIVFFWQLMIFFFNYVDLIKREPSTLGMRCWSQYGKLFLRHFNELDHELDARLNRAYRPAVKYMTSFSSPLMAVIAKFIVFICGGVLSILVLLTIYDEDVIQVEHVFTIMSLFGIAVVAARNFIPDENLIWCPEQLLRNVLAHAHYLPVSWRGFAHTTRVRDQFEQFFQLRAMYLVNELFSPFVTPFVLLFSLRPKALDLADFFRNFTVSVVGVGDVCSFAQMDVRKHGNPDWQITNSANCDITDDSPTSPNIPPQQCDTNQYTQGENGKTELSLVHFTLTNPQWKMPAEARHFVKGIRKHAIQDLNRTRNAGGLGPNHITAMGQSLMSVESMGGEYSSIIQSIYHNYNLSNSIIQQQYTLPQYQNYAAQQPPQNISQQQQSNLNSPQTYDFERMLHQNLTDGSTAPLRSLFLPNINEDDGIDENTEAQTSRVRGSESTNSHLTCSVRGGMARREGPIEGSQEGLLFSLYGGGLNSNTDLNFTPEYTATDMSLSTLYLHELHHNHMRRRGVRLEQSQRTVWQRPHQQQPPVTAQSFTPSTSNTAAEKTPLLGLKKS